jgi:hypothetical protein
MSSTTRLYLHGPSGHRTFYWVQLADDKSLYFGSSNGDLFRYGFGCAFMSSPTMEPIVPERDGRALSPRELAGKTSLHASGVVNLATETGGRRERLKIATLRDGFDALPLAAVLPMHPGRYPLSRKAIKPTDLCIPECLQNGASIALLIYVCANASVVPPPVTVARQRLPVNQEFSCELGELCLRAFLYSDPSQLPNWPKEEVQVVAHPTTLGSEPNWPFFA